MNDHPLPPGVAMALREIVKASEIRLPEPRKVLAKVVRSAAGTTFDVAPFVDMHELRLNTSVAPLAGG